MKAERKRVLIVDDDSFMIRVLKMKLEKGDYEVFTAPNGDEGLRQVSHCKPHVVISDLNMPQMNGWEMCRAIAKSAEAQPDLIIIITSWIEREERAKIQQFPNAKFVDKPVSPKKILQLIQQHLSHLDNQGID